jgi:predicted ArsR family transcriptional regulator
MFAHSRNTAPDVSTRRIILDLLKRGGPTDARSLAPRVKRTPMAVRLQLHALEGDGLVSPREERRRSRGRPAKLWRLTPDAEALFPDSHADLTLGLLEATRTALGEAGLRKVLAALARRQAQAYGRMIPARAPLSRRLAALARIRNEEGYMTELRRLQDGSHLLIENHCAICAAAKAYPGLCQAEIATFCSVLGPAAVVNRTEHLPAGGRRCVYRVTPAASGRAGATGRKRRPGARHNFGKDEPWATS